MALDNEWNTSNRVQGEAVGGNERDLVDEHLEQHNEVPEQDSDDEERDSASNWSDLAIIGSAIAVASIL